MSDQGEDEAEKEEASTSGNVPLEEEQGKKRAIFEPENYPKITQKLPALPVEETPQAAKPKPKFSGKVGRQRTNDEVDEILDYIIAYGEPPKGLSRKMRLYYLKHERLEERRKRYVREKRQKNQASGHASNVVPYRKRGSG